MMRSRISAGLLMFRWEGYELEVLLAHPGGPFFARQDDGAWTIPKGEAAPEEELLTRAQIEFQEEVGIAAAGDYLPLGSIVQKGGKVVHGWAFKGDLPDSFVHRSDTFELEWPRSSGRFRTFPEIDRVQFFRLDDARQKLKAAQVPFLERLVALVHA